MSKNSNSIPRLNLAPKLNRPLSLWNPFDYLRLLYWVFFFPQALRWYDENNGKERLNNCINWKQRIQFIFDNYRYRYLLIQGLFLIIFIACLETLFKDINFVNIDWKFFPLSAMLCLAITASKGVSYGLPVGLIFALFGKFEWNSILFSGVLLSSIVFGLEGGIPLDLVLNMGGLVSIVGVWAVVLGLGGSLAWGFLTGFLLTLSFVVLLPILLIVFQLVYIWRFENWIIVGALYLVSNHRNCLLPRITPIPVPRLNFRLKRCLLEDWQLGLHNIDQLLKYSLQFIPVIRALNQTLVEIPNDQLIEKVSDLAKKPHNWKVVKFASASLSEEFKLQILKGMSFVKLYQKASSSASTRLDTLPRAIAAGFWHLHEKEPEAATEAFSRVRSLLYGEEMFILAQTLAQFKAAPESETIAEIQVSAFPSEPLLRPLTWKAMHGLRRVVEDTKLTLGATSRSARSFALNRAIGQLRTIQDTADTLPQAEQGLIVDIAQTWKEALERISQDVGNISITKPVQNPYVIGDPVVGDLFIGREDIMRQLEELWVMSSQLQSVVLAGHRRMGKTSILLNIVKCLGSEVKVTYVNLKTLETIYEGVGDIFLAISDEISESLNVSIPDEEDFFKHPSLTFKRYLKKVIKYLDTAGLIIALDEFETIEALIDAGQLPANFMAVLRGFVQMSPQVAFAFAGLHTLEEMTEDYFQPFFASVIPIRVGFLTAAATAQILDNPDPDFPLSYQPDAHEKIYNLTHGQPYLVQLIGFYLVRRYNDQMFERGNPRDPVFTVEDVDAVINGTFFQNGRYYFTGVWGQAAEGAPHQQEVLKVLASHPEGCDRTTLRQTTGLDETALNNALETLSRHDVIIEAEGNIRIAVELFRMWVEQNQCS